MDKKQGAGYSTTQEIILRLTNFFYSHPPREDFLWPSRRFWEFARHSDDKKLTHCYFDQLHADMRRQCEVQGFDVRIAKSVNI